jgi:ATP-dependent Clp protease ATP-binding subunit ClpA
MVVQRQSKAIRARVLMAAMAETRRRGDRRLGTVHLLLGLLHERDSAAVRALGIDLATARAALDALDRAALAAIGISIDQYRPAGPVASGKHPPLSSAARTVLLRAIKPTPRTKGRHPTAEHLLLSLLACPRPDPSAELLAQLGIDPETVRHRLEHR